MLTSALVNYPVKKKIYEKRKKIINILTIFFISHKNNVKTFLKQIFKCLEALVNITQNLFYYDILLFYS